MAKILMPHMPVYVYDLDASRDCRRMLDAEFGRYMRLLFRQWMEGSVPVNALEAIKDAGLDLESSIETQSLLERKFTLLDTIGRRNPRCHEERERILKKLKTLRKNGRRGGRPKSEPEGKPSGYPEGYPDGKPDGSIRASVSVSVSESTKKKKGGAGENFPPPDGSSPEFVSAWADWQQHRREAGHPLTATGARKQLAKLAELGELRAVAAMNASMANSWQGIFEEKQNGTGRNTGERTTQRSVSQGRTGGDRAGGKPPAVGGERC